MTSTRYAFVCESLQQAIASGELGAGGVLPTEAELCARYAASRTTIRHALQTLQTQGMVESRQGSGWTVDAKHRGPTAPRFRVRSAPDGPRTRPGVAQPTAHTIGHCVRRPPVATARALHAPRSARLLMVERVTRARAAVIHRAEIWFNRDYSARLDPCQARDHPPARLLAQLGQPFGRFDQYVEAVPANQRDHELLGTPLGRPVLQVVRTGYDRQDAPLFRSYHRHPGHITQLEIGFPTSDQQAGTGVVIDAY
jgi:GntR family transcriptional regulator